MQAATIKPGRTTPSAKPVHTTETYTATLPATGCVRLPVASAVRGVAKSTIWAWSAQGRFPKPSSCRRVSARGRLPTCAHGWPMLSSGRLPTRWDAKPWPTRKNPQAQHHCRSSRKTQLTF